MSSDVFVYETDKCLVRIHTGKRTEEERREVLIRAFTEQHWKVEKRNPGYLDRISVSGK